MVNDLTMPGRAKVSRESQPCKSAGMLRPECKKKCCLLGSVKFHPELILQRLIGKKVGWHPKSPLGNEEKTEGQERRCVRWAGTLSVDCGPGRRVLWEEEQTSKYCIWFTCKVFACSAKQKLMDSQEWEVMVAELGPLWRCNQLHQQQEHLEHHWKLSLFFKKTIVAATSHMWLLNTWDVSRVPEELRSLFYWFHLD